MPKNAGDSVKVICRFRPQNRREKAEGGVSVVEVQDEKCCMIHHPDSSRYGRSLRFAFDRVFGPGTTQPEVFDAGARDLVDKVFEGFNSTIFAYGQTGAGKTYSMEGALGSPSRGIVPRVVETIFEKIYDADEIMRFELVVSYVEIYREALRDLFQPENKGMRIREDRKTGVYIEGVTQIGVRSPDEVIGLMETGAKNRTVSATNMNATSSRSHGVFMLKLISENTETGSSSSAKLMMVDLAGSEKISKTGATGDTLEEAKKINQSLSALGNVMNALSTGKKHVAYRDSVLTRLLSDSLGGNCRTTLLIACSPSSYNVDETIGTLRFGERAKKIKNKAKANVQKSVAEYEKELQQAQKQIDYLSKLAGALQRDLEAVFRGELTKREDSEALRLIEMKASDVRKLLADDVVFDADNATADAMYSAHRSKQRESRRRRKENERATEEEFDDDEDESDDDVETESPEIEERPVEMELKETEVVAPATQIDEDVTVEVNESFDTRSAELLEELRTKQEEAEKLLVKCRETDKARMKLEMKLNRAKQKLNSAESQYEQLRTNAKRLEQEKSSFEQELNNARRDVAVAKSEAQEARREQETTVAGLEDRIRQLQVESQQQIERVRTEEKESNKKFFQGKVEELRKELQRVSKSSTATHFNFLMQDREREHAEKMNQMMNDASIAMEEQIELRANLQEKIAQHARDQMEIHENREKLVRLKRDLADKERQVQTKTEELTFFQEQKKQLTELLRAQSSNSTDEIEKLKRELTKKSMMLDRIRSDMTSSNQQVFAGGPQLGPPPHDFYSTGFVQPNMRISLRGGGGGRRQMPHHAIPIQPRHSGSSVGSSALLNMSPSVSREQSPTMSVHSAQSTQSARDTRSAHAKKRRTHLQGLRTRRGDLSHSPSPVPSSERDMSSRSSRRTMSSLSQALDESMFGPTPNQYTRRQRRQRPSQNGFNLQPTYSPMRSRSAGALLPEEVPAQSPNVVRGFSHESFDSNASGGSDMLVYVQQPPFVVSPNRRQSRRHVR